MLIFIDMVSRSLADNPNKASIAHAYVPIQVGKVYAIGSRPKV